MDEPVNVRPYVLAALLCDSVINEEGTGKKTIVGTFDRLHAPEFPVAYPFTLYVKVVDAAGNYNLRLDYVHISADKLLSSQDVGLFTPVDRLAPSELTIRMAVQIPTPGDYEFRLYANDEWLCRLAFTATLITPQSVEES